MRGSRTSIALLLAAALAGCGSSGDKQPGLTGGQAQGLVTQLEAARVAAGARDVAATKAAIGKFRSSVARLRGAGALSDATARSLRIGAARILERVQSDNAAPVAPAPTLTQTAPTQAPPGQKKKQEDKKHGKGDKKHGRKKD